jgi:hypothetical protein
MPFSSEDLDKLDSELNLDDTGSSSRSNLDLASQNDPDRYVQSKQLATDTNLPLDTVESNFDEVQRQKSLNDIDLRVNPKVDAFLDKFDNAQIAFDDVDNLKLAETTTDDRSQIRKSLSSLGAGSARMMSDLVQSVGNWMKPDRLGEDTLKQLPDDQREAIEAIQGSNYKVKAFNAVGTVIEQFGASLGESAEGFYETGDLTTIEEVIDDPTNALKFIGDHGPGSAPYLILAGVNLPAMILSMGQSIAEERVDNDGRDEVSQMDMAVGTTFGLGSSLLDRFFVDDLAKAALTVRESAKTVVKGTAVEGGSGLIEYTGGSIFTEEGFDITDAAKATLSEALVGMGISAPVETVKLPIERMNRKQVEGSMKAIATVQEQAYIDDVISFSQSKTNQRDSKVWGEFIESLDPDAEVVVTSEFVEEMINTPGMSVPDYMLNQYEQGLESDIAIKLDQFATDFAPYEDIMNVMRPHLKMSHESMSQNDIEANNESFNETIQRMVQNATADQELKDEADQIFESVKEQLVATGRMSEQTATHSAAIIPAVVSTQVERLRAEGHDISVTEFYENHLKFKVEGPIGETETGDILYQNTLDDLIAEFDDLDTGIYDKAEVQPDDFGEVPYTGIIDDIPTDQRTGIWGTDEGVVRFNDDGTMDYMTNAVIDYDPDAPYKHGFAKIKMGDNNSRYESKIEEINAVKIARDRIRQSLPERPDTVAWTPDRVSRLSKEYGHANGTHSKGMIAYVDPIDFIFATTNDPTFIEKESVNLNVDQLTDETQTPFLNVTDGKVSGHEGRHRMMALAKAGVSKVPVVIKNTDDYMDTSFEGEFTLDGQLDQSAPITMRGGKLITKGNVEAINQDMQSLDPKFFFQSTSLRKGTETLKTFWLRS